MWVNDPYKQLFVVFTFWLIFSSTISLILLLDIFLFLWVLEACGYPVFTPIMARWLSFGRIIDAEATEVVAEVAAVAQNITQCCGSSNDGDG